MSVTISHPDPADVVCKAERAERTVDWLIGNDRMLVIGQEPPAANRVLDFSPDVNLQIGIDTQPHAWGQGVVWGCALFSRRHSS